MWTGSIFHFFLSSSSISIAVISKWFQGRVDCIRSASTEALEWAKAVCQGEGANVPLESDKEDEGDTADRKVKFKIYSVKSLYSI